MKIDLKKFEGTLPYASELFGIYQPLLGWRSKLTQDRLARGNEALYRNATQRALARFRSDLIVTPLPQPGHYKVTPLQIVDGVSTTRVPRVAYEIDSIIARVIATDLPANKVPKSQDWAKLLVEKVLNAELRTSAQRVEMCLANAPQANAIPPDARTYILKSIDERRKAYNNDVGKDVLLKEIMQREISVSSYLNWLSLKKSDTLEALFYRHVTDPLADIEAYTFDPLATFGSNDLEAVLSPIGLVHLFRQYFFEFDTFLGPPVGHIWMSPGATLELVEETVRRTLVERVIETSTERLDRSEKTDSVEDELSTATREENRTNTKFGFGANVNYDNGTTEAGAHTDLSLDNSRTSARDVAHKQKREQSQKVTAEIRQSFKSTFRTVSESTSTSSRRYLLQNTTKDLINYELRRKMRQVGVQVQDIGTQLCWQVFVDDPGRALGVAKLLHIAEPPDLASLHAPERPATLEPKVVEVNLQFPYMRDPSSEGDGETDCLYIDGDDQEHIGGIHNVGYNDRIFNKKTFTLVPPAPGYTLSPQIPPPRSQHSGTVEAVIEQTKPGAPEVLVTLKQVNFKDQPNVELQLTTTWLPDPAQQNALMAAYTVACAAYTAEKSRLERTSFLKAAKERITLASQIRSRKFEDLREEERIAVYRRLIAQLMSVGDKQQQDRHTTSELIRAIFDVDKMLYFVAPEWWQVRQRAQGNSLAVGDTKDLITEDDIVMWEGPKATGRTDNYLITEESNPAPLGSSLGWLLQLDGDTLRNAFLNSPWVKAIIPIRPGREEAAINWLSLANVVGANGLTSAYQASTEELEKIEKRLKKAGLPQGNPITLHDALIALGLEIKDSFVAANTAKPSPFDPKANVIPTETVYEHGFYALQGSFEVNTDPTRVFSQWIEVVSTDQVAAVPYDAAAHL
jgi:hypothetical protein